MPTQQPKWKEVGHIGDVNWPEYGGGPVMIDETGVYPPELEYVEPPPDELSFDSPKARWEVYRVPLEPNQPWGDREDLEAVARTSGQDPDELADAFASDDPMERAYAYETWAGHFGWYELDQYPLRLTCPEVEKRYDTDLNCFGDVQNALEEEVQRMADENSAESWSAVGDAMQSDVEAQGFDPDTIVSIAEFGDAVAVNGELTDKTVHGVESKLEAEGYELTDYGGRIPSSEGYANAESVIEAVARELKLPREWVEQAAERLKWWQEEIPWGGFGDASVWAKRRV